jgi:hypothetical protein
MHTSLYGMMHGVIKSIVGEAKQMSSRFQTGLMDRALSYCTSGFLTRILNTKFMKRMNNCFSEVSIPPTPEVDPGVYKAKHKAKHQASVKIESGYMICQLL